VNAARICSSERADAVSSTAFGMQYAVSRSITLLAT
jgi:hypothetical protein